MLIYAGVQYQRRVVRTESARSFTQVYHHKRITRKVAELKFRIEKVKQVSIQESLFPDIEDLTPVAVELVQADVERPVALKIASQEWEYVNPDKLPDPGTYTDFAAYVSEKIEMSLDVDGSYISVRKKTRNAPERDTLSSKMRNIISIIAELSVS